MTTPYRVSPSRGKAECSRRGQLHPRHDSQPPAGPREDLDDDSDELDARDDGADEHDEEDALDERDDSPHAHAGAHA
ncbi:hypothetical protein VdG1_05985 [Verticillium dahliae VDG1]|nr:hypothetical protein VdG1_05985 [Verticillium dahliae VDG1]